MNFKSTGPKLLRNAGLAPVSAVLVVSTGEDREMKQSVTTIFHTFPTAFPQVIQGTISKTYGLQALLHYVTLACCG